MTVGIGSEVWVFDGNRRVYAKRASGLGGPPIWIKHWRPERVVSETSRSWITDHDTKVPKRGDVPIGIATSEAQIRRRAWVEVHRWKLADAIKRCDDPEVLARIAGWIGFTAPDDGEVDHARSVDTNLK